MEESHGEGGHVSPTNASLFIITCIVIGVSTKFFLSKLKVPYTALLQVFGLCIGLLQATAPKTAAFTATLQLWMHIDPHLLLLIFLPTIGFSAALRKEPHLLRRHWGQIMILAWPGVVVTFILIAVCGRYFFPYGWTWPQALLFGAMLSATDPAAVILGLHEVGADEKLCTVIDGEALVNDGSALVIFLVLQQIVQDVHLTAGQIVVSFVRVTLVSAALGLGFGLVTSFWLANIWNDPVLEIVLTLGAAYGCDFVAEHLSGASGLLAVVVMGFSMSLLGGRHITDRIKVEMHTFWNVLEWLAHTILFVWVGIVLGYVLLEPANPALRPEGITFSRHLTATDAGYCVVLYFWLLVARGITVFLFYPLLSWGRVDYGMMWQTALFVIWAGLRGAVGVAMSLFILLDPLIEGEEFKVHCVFFMAIMAFCTVLINGTTARYVLEGLGLLKMTPQQLDVLQHVLKDVDGIADATLAGLHPDDVLGPPDPSLVKRWSAVGAADSLSPAHNRTLRRLNLQPLHSGGHPKSAGSVRTDAIVQAAVQNEPRDRRLAEYRARLLNVVKASYGDMYQHFEITTPGIRLLQEATDKALDAASGTATCSSSSSNQNDRKQQHSRSPAGASEVESGGSVPHGGLTDWAEVRQQLEAPGWGGRLGEVAGRLRMPTIAEKMSQREVASKLQLVSSFVSAHSIGQQVFQTHFESAEPTTDGNNTGHISQNTPDEHPARAGRSLGDAGDADVEQQVLRESCAEADAALQYAHKVLLPQHPSLGRLLMSRHVAIQVLERVEDFLKSIEDSGLVRAEETHGLQHRAAVSLERLQHQRTWNIITLERQEAAKAAAAGSPAVSSSSCTSAGTTQQYQGSAGAPEPYMAQVREQERGPGVDLGAAKGEQQRQGVLLSDLHHLRSGLSEMRQRVAPRK